METRELRALLAALEEIRTHSAGPDVGGLEHRNERAALAKIHGIASRAIDAFDAGMGRGVAWR